MVWDIVQIFVIETENEEVKNKNITQKSGNIGFRFSSLPPKAFRPLKNEINSVAVCVHHNSAIWYYVLYERQQFQHP